MDVSVPRKEKMLVGMVPCAGGDGGRQIGDGVVSDGSMRKRGQGRRRFVMALGALCVKKGGEI